MKPAVLLLLLFFAAPALAAPVAEPDRWAVGLMLGAPTGLSIKRYMGDDAVDAGLGFVGPGVRLHADYLWGLAQLLSDPRDLRLNLNVGVGGMLGFCEGPYGPYRGVCSDSSGGAYVGARVPFGLELVLRKAPVAFGLEVAPGLGFGFGRVRGLLDVILHVRLLL